MSVVQIADLRVGTILSNLPAYGDTTLTDASGESFLCLVPNGRTLMRERFPALCEVLKYAYGGTEGGEEFRLPDLRGLRGDHLIVARHE